ncbi:SHOCT domain-containing protein [Mycolicibacterium vinylchloridicum]|uniref:SHOCT domain-containing protein n=1 Tax=Mycolicibacterium vinylchloridicum TaxID=2736928 RepID=UPI0015CA2BBA|nr:hypothetical protein [Mycolicibacterium vinylchloridicum]
MMFWYDHDLSGWGYAGMAVAMLAFWVLIAAGIVALIRFSAASPQQRTIPRPPLHDESPEQLLALRFARGEIDETEYQQRVAILRGTKRE